MWDSDCQSIFSDASDSDTGSVFSDGGSSCDEIVAIINPTMNQLKIAPERSLVKSNPVCFQAQSFHLKILVTNSTSIRRRQICDTIIVEYYPTYLITTNVEEVR